MSIFEQIEDIARAAWEKSEPGELERPEHNRLVNSVCCIADKLALEARWHEDCFYFADTGSPIFPMTISGVHKALVWLQQEQNRRDSDVLFDCIHSTPGRGAQALFALRKGTDMNQLDRQE